MPRHSFSRRHFLRTAAVTALALRAPAFLRAAPAADRSAAAAERAVAELFRRFVAPETATVLHFAGLDGRVILPTAEDCSLARPNGMAWCTPVEDGPFYGGLLLDALCRRWAAARTAAAARDARTIARGLVALGRASAVDGFIARGFAADGRSHYPASSEDQTLPWFYGLWRYVRSGLPDAAERAMIVALLERHARGLEGHGWQIPCDPPAFGFRGNYVRPKHTDAARLLFLVRAMHDLTGRERWLGLYRELALAVPGPDGRTRRDWAGAGMDYHSPAVPTYEYQGTASVSQKLWTSAIAQAALRGLWELETDPAWRAGYAQGLAINARNAVPHLDRWRRYDPANRLAFDVDWRFLFPSWRPQASCDEAILLGRKQLPLWAERNPRSIWEDDVMREPLFAGWIIALSGDAALLRAHREELHALVARYEWEGLYTSLFFGAVGLHHQLAGEA